MWKLIDFTLTPEQDLLALINRDNNTTLTLEDVKFSLPLPANVQGRNTRVTVTSLNRRKFIGYKEIYYRRILFSSFGPIELLLEDPFTVNSVIGLLGSQNAVVLTANDIMDFSFLNTLNIGEVKNIVISANLNSYRWLGSSPAEICFGLPPNIADLNHLLRDILPTPGYLP